MAESDPIRPLPVLVGREAYRSMLDGLFAADAPVVTVLHGIGGIGKSMLLRDFALRHPDAVERMDVMALPTDLRGLAAGARERVIVLDGLDQVPNGEAILRTKLIPQLDRDARIVLATRSPPGVRWAADLGVGCFRAIALTGLTNEDAQELLRRRGHAVPLDSAVIELCHGHPLMLALAGELEDPEVLVDAGLDHVPSLLVALVEATSAVPGDAVHGEAVLACAIARRTSEPMLREVLGVDDARPAFEWLRRQSWAQIDADGIFPHALVRQVQRADCKWRDRARYDAVFGAVVEFAVSRVRSHGARALRDVTTLLADVNAYRGVSADPNAALSGPPVRCESFDPVPEFFEGPYGPSHVRTLRELHGSEHLDLWELLDVDGRPRELLSVVDPELLRGDPHAHPVVAAAQRLVAGLSLQPGAGVVFSLGSSSRGRGMSCPLGNTRILLGALALSYDTPGLAALGSVLTPAELWRPLVERMEGISRFEEVEVDGQTLIVQVQDLRSTDLAGWLAMQFAPPPPGSAPRFEVLDRDEFAIALRKALRALNTEALGSTRLANTVLGQRRGTGGLRDCIVAAIDGLPEGRERSALVQTYVVGGRKQFAIAAELGLSFATYRRALSAGLEALTESLWQLESSV